MGHREVPAGIAGRRKRAGWRLGALLSVSLLALAISTQPAAAHGDVRYVPYNVVQNKSWDGCNYQIQHGWYGGAYANKRLTSGNCHEAIVWVTGCQGWNCPDGQQWRTTEFGVWISSTLPGFDMLYSHNGFPIVNGVLYHNTVW